MLALEPIIASHYIKYEALGPIIFSSYMGSEAKHINLFIDMYSCMRAVYGNKKTGMNDYRGITSGIINMCAHYRTFFRRLKVETSIYIVMSNNLNDNQTRMVNHWNNAYYSNWKQNQGITNMIMDNTELLGTLCPYLPDIHFIVSNYEVTSVIAALIPIIEQSPNIIISRDLIPCTLLTGYPETMILRPKKYNNKDLSFGRGPIRNSDDIVTFWKLYCAEQNVSEPRNIIHPVNLPMLWALNGCKSRSIKPIVNIREAEALIYNIVKDAPIKLSVDTFFANTSLTKDIRRDILQSRYNAFDATGFQLALYLDSPEWSLVKTTINDDKENPEEVKRINDMYFTNNPLMLDML